MINNRQNRIICLWLQKSILKLPVYILISNIGRNLNFKFCCSIFINRNICALHWVSFITKLLLLIFQKQSRTSSNDTNNNTEYTRHSSNDYCNWVSIASHLIDCCSITWFFYIVSYCTNICNLHNVKKQHYCTTTTIYNLINNNSKNKTANIIQ